MNTKSKYERKTFSVLGDSISTLIGYSYPDFAVFYNRENKLRSGIFTPADTWWGRVIARLGGELLVNNSYSGSTVCKHPMYEIESYGCSDERTAALGMYGQVPDVIMILLGINDWGRGMRIVPDEEECGLHLFSVAYETMLEKIKRNYPEAEIWCLTLPRSQWSRNPECAIPFSYSGGHIREYCEAIRICGEKAGCKVVDIYRPNDPYDTIDGFHPTVEGMRTIADAVLRELGAECSQT